MKSGNYPSIAFIEEINSREFLYFANIAAGITIARIMTAAAIRRISGYSHKLELNNARTKFRLMIRFPMRAVAVMTIAEPRTMNSVINNA